MTAITNTCANCGRPARDAAYGCDHCGDQLARALGDVPWLDEQMEVTITRQAGIDYRRLGGGKGGKKDAERPLPGNWTASEARTHLRALLVLWARLCHEEGVRNSDPREGLPDDNLPAISRWLLWRVDGLMLHEAAGDVVSEITEAVAHCHRLIDRVPDKWYAGPCNEQIEGVECETDLYALSDRGGVTCSTCGATYDVAARRTWLLEAAEDRLADANTLARSVSWLGAVPLNAARVRKWAERDRIVAKGHIDGRPLYRIGDAIDLMAASVKSKEAS